MSTTSLRNALLVAGLACASCFSARLGLRNQTTTTLVPYPVVTTPPPPHRQADPANALAPGEFQELDPAGFNPLYYAAGVSDPALPNALHLSLDLYESDPAVILWRVFHYPVPPDQVGTDPALQPQLLREELEELEDRDSVLRLIEGPSDQGPGWRIEVVQTGP